MMGQYQEIDEIVGIIASALRELDDDESADD